MASELRVTTIANNAGTESVDSTYVINGSAKAWNSFDGTVSSNYVLDSFNSSSFTDNGTGSYIFAFTSSMSNDDYASPAGYGETETADHGIRWPHRNTHNTTSQTRGLSNNGNGDVGRVHVTILGDLA